MASQSLYEACVLRDGACDQRIVAEDCRHHRRRCARWRSANAAKEIKSLIDDSGEKVGTGTWLVEEAVAASRAMRDQAGRLPHAVSVFRVDGSAQQAPASRVVQRQWASRQAARTTVRAAAPRKAVAAGGNGDAARVRHAAATAQGGWEAF